MHAEDARQRYQMSLISEDAKGYGVSIKPKLQEDKESFSIAFVNLDRRYLLPVRIMLKSPDGKSLKDFRLGPMYPNSMVNDKNFEGKPLGSPWKIVRNPGGEDRPARGGTEPAATDRERPPPLVPGPTRSSGSDVQRLILRGPAGRRSPALAHPFAVPPTFPIASRFDGFRSHVYNHLEVGGSAPPVRAFFTRPGTFVGLLDWFSPKEPAA